MAVRVSSNPELYRRSRRLRVSGILSALLSVSLISLAIPPTAQAQRGEGRLVQTPPSGISVQDIINKFAEKEKQFRAARAHYTYRQSNIIQTLEGDTVDGEYRQDWDVNFDNQG
jgi:hypothetical protein